MRTDSTVKDVKSVKRFSTILFASFMLFVLFAVQSSAASPDLRTPPLGAASLATNLVATWGGYTFGCAKNGYNDHIFVEPGENLHALTVCSWVAMRDADIVDPELLVPVESPSRKTNVQPGLVYTPNVERAAPDLLGGAWGWGGAPVSVAVSLSFDYGFPPGALTFLEYVESTGSQWIDTGVAPDNNELDFIIDFENRRSGTALVAAFGCRQLTSAYSTGSYAVFLRSNEGNEGRIDIANTGVAKWMSFLVGVRYTIAWDSAAKQLTKTRVDTENSTTASAGQKTLCEYPFILGGINTAGEISSGAEMRLHSARFWKSGILVRDYIPAKDADGVAGLFDLVEGRFYRSATATPLVAGPEREPTNALERCYTLGWNGGATGTNTWPRGVYTVAWSNLTSTLTLTAGGTDMTLEAPAGVRNVVPGEAAGFILSGSGSGHVGISRTKVNPIYQTRLGSRGAGSDAEALLNAALVGTNWCFVAHRVALTADSHTNACDIIQLDGRHATEGHAPELPPDGCGALLTNGLYQLVYTAVSDLRNTFIYEWDRRQFGRWLSDEDLAAIYEDGVRTREAFVYPPCVYSYAVYQPDP